jgi:hypothetical protein
LSDFAEAVPRKINALARWLGSGIGSENSADASGVPSLGSNRDGILRVSIRRKLPVVEWPKQLYL